MEHVISDKLIELLQYRINQEEYSSRIYKAMSEWLGYNGYVGASKLWKTYSDEELKHADWAYSFLGDLDILPIVDKIEKPKCEYKGLVDIIQQSYKHEVEITAQCNELFQAAMKEGCGMVTQLALQYQKEQVEELGKTTYWLDRLEDFGEDIMALRFLDNEMGG
jgi:ferritin